MTATTKAERSVKITMLAADRLEPNNYNPNEMNDEDFAELVAELQHLGRLPKPIVVRRKDDATYEIVDREHGWRAAREVGMTTVSCEIIAADDFEAMRQTYKRNQHGVHNRVLLGRMFEKMMGERGLSRREVAKKMEVTEGTVRNALDYAKASGMRNSYAGDPPDGAPNEDISALSVRQIRGYLSLPSPIGDIWLSGGANLHVLRSVTDEVDTEDLTEIIKLGLDVTLEPYNFPASLRRALEVLRWRREHGPLIENIDAYILSAARLRMGTDILNKLPCVLKSEKTVPAVSREEWEAMLQDSDQRTESKKERLAMLTASIQLACRRAGQEAQDATNPMIAWVLEELKSAPDFLRDAEIPLIEKKYLLDATAHVPDEVLMEAKCAACAALTSKQRWLRGESAETAPASEHYAEHFSWATLTPEKAFQMALDLVIRGKAEKEREALFKDRAALTSAVITKLCEDLVIGEGKLNGQAAPDVLRERLSNVPDPEFKLMAGFILGHGSVACRTWFAELGGKPDTPGEKLEVLNDRK